MKPTPLKKAPLRKTFEKQAFWAKKQRRHRLIAFIVMLATSPIANLAPAHAQTAELVGQYAISVAGFKVAKASFSLAIDGNAYSAAMQASSAAVGRLFSSGTSTASASGFFRSKDVRPISYRMDSQSKKLRTHVSLTMRDGDVRKGQAAPPLRQTLDRVKLSKRHQRNVVDPLSAAIMPVPSTRQTTGPAACRRQIPVFDGWTRYDVQLTFKESREVTVGNYRGPVAVCTAKWLPIAGHRDGKPSVVHMRDRSNIETWIAPIGATRFTIPVRVQMDTQAGRLVVAASKLTITSGANVQASK